MRTGVLLRGLTRDGTVGTGFRAGTGAGAASTGTGTGMVWEWPIFAVQSCNVLARSISHVCGGKKKYIYIYIYTTYMQIYIYPYID